MHLEEDGLYIWSYFSCFMEERLSVQDDKDGNVSSCFRSDDDIDKYGILPDSFVAKHM